MAVELLPLFHWLCVRGKTAAEFVHADHYQLAKVFYGGRASWPASSGGEEVRGGGEEEVIS